MRIDACHAQGDFVRVGFPEQAGARGGQFFNHGGICAWAVVFKERRPGGGREGAGFDQIFNGEGNPRQRAGRAGRGQGGGDADEGVDLGVEPLNGLETGRGQAGGREFPGLELFKGRSNRQGQQVHPPILPLRPVEYKGFLLKGFR